MYIYASFFLLKQSELCSDVWQIKKTKEFYPEEHTNFMMEQHMLCMPVHRVFITCPTYPTASFLSETIDLRKAGAHS